LNITHLTHGPSGGNIFTRIVDGLRRDGYILLDEVFTLAQLQCLFIDIKKTDRSVFHAAGIGRQTVHQLNEFVRRDRICWLGDDNPEVRFYLAWMEQLRLCLNRELFLGLFDYECHYAHYPKGAFYKTHLDAFRGSSNRRLTTILYLNPSWQVHDGGELLLYAASGEQILETVQPKFGNMLIFLSEEFPHEVLPTNKSRYSLTGWFRINTNIGRGLDPPA
jgi:SM-20-related protein